MDMLNRNSMALIHMCMAVQLYSIIAGIARGFFHTSAVFMSLRVARQTWQVLDANFLPLVRKVLTIVVQLLPSHMVLYTFTALALRQNSSWPTTESERSWRFSICAAVSSLHTELSLLFLFKHELQGHADEGAVGLTVQPEQLVPSLELERYIKDSENGRSIHIICFFSGSTACYLPGHRHQLWPTAPRTSFQP